MQLMQTDMHLKQKPRTMLTFPLNFEKTQKGVISFIYLNFIKTTDTRLLLPS